MIIFRFVLVVFLSGACSAFAGEKQISKSLVQQLKVEYRLRLGAQKLMTEVSLFDGFGVLGRGIVPEVTSIDKNEPITATGEGRLPEAPLLPLGPSGETLTVSPVTVEINTLDFGPLLDLQMQIDNVEAALREQNVLDEAVKFK